MEIMMRKCDELADPDSCLNRAEPEEWLFTLLGRDESAPVAVRAWIEDRILTKKNVRSDTEIHEAEAWIKNVVDELVRSPKHARRLELAEKSSRFALSTTEAAEFVEITASFFDWMRRVWPMIPPQHWPPGMDDETNCDSIRAAVK